MTVESFSQPPSDATSVVGVIERPYEDHEVRALVSLVEDASALVSRNGESAFADFRKDGSRWRTGETYVFVLDVQGTMLVHPDAAIEGTNQIGLTDTKGKPIVRGLIEVATGSPGAAEGWYHYEWPVPGGLFTRWKSSYVRGVSAPSGTRYVIGSGIYNDRMERAFVVDIVRHAVRELEGNAEAAYARFRDPSGPFIAKDAYVFVLDMNGTELVNPAFPNLEGRNLLNLKDAKGKLLVRDMLETVHASGSGWVEYAWPKPGESVPTQKSAYVAKGTAAGIPVVVGCGVYLAEAPKAAASSTTITAAELVRLVREAAAVLERDGEAAYRQFRHTGRWFHDETYFFVWSIAGRATLHTADPSREGQDESALQDVLGRPFGKLFLDVGASAAGEGWVHYMYPRPGEIFPAWKSTFLKRVTFPSGQPHIVGCGVYNMQMDAAFIEDVVDRAAALIAERGRDAFGQLRDRRGPFVFMDTYVFVLGMDGTELVNPAQPKLEGQKLVGLKDLMGKDVAREEIDAACAHGSAWLECYWYKPGHNTPARKRAYVRKVISGDETFVVGSGFYVE